MAERFQTLTKNKSVLYSDDCSVVIEARALLKDNENGRILAQLKLRSLSEKRIIACRVKITAYEPNGQVLSDDISYLYLDLSADCGTAFGSDKPIYLPNATARNISPVVTEITYSDGSVWQKNTDNWKELPEQDDIGTVLNNEEIIQYRSHIGIGDAVKVPVMQGSFFRCTCGAVNPSNTSNCLNCCRSVENIISYFDKSALKEEIEAGKSQKSKERKSMIKVATICLCLITSFIIFGAVAKSISDKSKQYDFAVKYMETGKYEEAKSMFKNLGNFKDSDQMIETVDKTHEYYFALDLIEKKQYNDAITMLEKLGDFKDSKERIEKINEGQYNEAVREMELKHYHTAVSIFESLGTYKDSLEMKEIAQDAIKEEKYNLATEYMKKYIQIGNHYDFEEAINIFNTLGDYKDSIEKIETIQEIQNETIYNSALKDLENQRYRSAMSGFESLGDYKDSKKMVEKVKLQSIEDFKGLADSGDFYDAYNLSDKIPDKTFEELMKETGYEEKLLEFEEDFRSYAGQYIENSSSMIFEKYTIECDNNWKFVVKDDWLERNASEHYRFIKGYIYQINLGYHEYCFDSSKKVITNNEGKIVAEYKQE